MLTCVVPKLMDFIDDMRDFAKAFKNKHLHLSSLFRPFVNLVMVDLDFSVGANFTRNEDTALLPGPRNPEFLEAFNFLRALTQLVEFNARRLELVDLLYIRHYVPLPQLKVLRLLDIITNQAYTSKEAENYRPYTDKVCLQLVPSKAEHG